MPKTESMRVQAELVIDCRNDLGEMPLWCARTRTLFWVDVTAPGRVFYWDSARGSVDFYQFEDLVTGLARSAHDALLVVGSRTIFEFEAASRKARHVYTLPADQPDHRFNDGACDRAGRLWVGSMQNNFLESVRATGRLQDSGKIYVVSSDGSARIFEAALACPNAMCWSPDDATFYVADSVNGWIYSYAFDLAAGHLANRRELCRFADLGIPDGAAVDEQGYIWNARWGAGSVVRISPAGQIDHIIKVPTTNPTACCFGERDMTTLFITSARYGLTPAQLASERCAGGIFALRTDVPGIEKAPFGR